MSQNLKTLISKLNDSTRKAAERAASLCMGRGHYEVDIEHLLLALLEQPQSDLALLCQRFDVSATALQRDLETELSRFKAGNTRTPVFSSHLPVWLEHAWLIASLESHTARIRSGHLVLALLSEASLSQIALRSSKLFTRFRVDELKHRMDELTRGSSEAVQALRDIDAPSAGEADADHTVAHSAQTPALDQFTTNLTQRALDGKVDPVIGRDAEIRQAIDILMRRRQNNPILTGEAGVGKTAVVEGHATLYEVKQMVVLRKLLKTCAMIS